MNTVALDPIEILNREIKRAGGVAYIDGRELIALRGAIAELIDAAKDVVLYRYDDPPLGRLAAALDRVGAKP